MLRFLRMGNKRTKTIWWILIIVTVVTFLGGFVFIFGAGFSDGRMAATQTGAIGTVNGEPLRREDLAAAVAEQRANYQRQYNQDPVDRDARVVELQAWRALVNQRLLAAEAEKLGLKAYDPEVVHSLRATPPQLLTTYDAFKTNGQFDPQKYQQALRDPSINWSPFEDLVREQLPVRKLQERMLSSIKLSEPELREAFRDRYEKLAGVVVHVMPLLDTTRVTPTQAQLDQAWEKHKARFYVSSRTQVEIMQIAKQLSEEDVRTARQIATGLVERARRGEDFAQLVKDYSEGPNAAQGGAINRVFQPSELGPFLGANATVAAPGMISDPVQDGSRFVILKVLESVPDPVSPVPSLRVAQLVVKIQPSTEKLREQYTAIKAARDKARTAGLGKAAAEIGQTTIKSGLYSIENTPQMLLSAPEAAEWGLHAKPGEVSPVFEGIDEFVVVQCTDQKPAGTMSREDAAETIRQLAEMDIRLERNKPLADRVQAAVAAGQTLEQAGAAAGLSPMPIRGMTRQTPPPQLSAVPEVSGAMFGGPIGKTVGPIRAVNGWFFFRADSLTPADPAQFEQVKGQLSTEILQRRQQAFFAGYITRLLDKAKVVDMRTSGQ